MKCNIIAQRISLQEILIPQQEEILKEAEELMNDEDKIKTLDRVAAEQLFSKWIA